MTSATDCNMNRETPPKSQSNFETMDKSMSTLKRNPKTEFNKPDLLRLLAYLEGELQARDIVIATLKSERMKQYLIHNKYHSISDKSDPVAALQRDSFATVDHGKDSVDMQPYINGRKVAAENFTEQCRKSETRIHEILEDAESRFRKERDAEIEKRKTIEQKLENFKQKFNDEMERHKQMILFLLAERKKIVLKYIEERKRSEDLAQILTEEKVRVDAMAEGLEEESKKSLKMEAELEKQLAQFYLDSQKLKLSLAKQEKKCKDLEHELSAVNDENSILRHQLGEIKKGQNVVPCSAPSIDGTEIGPAASSGPGLQCVTPMMTSIAKVVQPTATVSSVPVSGPMTGIARSVSPGHHVRYVMYSPMNQSTQAPSAGKVVESTQFTSTTTASQQEERRNVTPVAAIRSATINNSPHPKLSASSIVKNHSGGELNVATIARKPIPLGRGVPPPVPPNKPIVPPKKDLLNRKLEMVSNDNPDLKNTQNRGPVLPSVKVKLQNMTEKPVEEDVNRDMNKLQL